VPSAQWKSSYTRSGQLSLLPDWTRLRTSARVSCFPAFSFFQLADIEFVKFFFHGIVTGKRSISDHAIQQPTQQYSAAYLNFVSRLCSVPACAEVCAQIGAGTQ
jgi:hypothetical protein